MTLPPVRGHAGARAALGRAIRQGSLPQSILLYGPPGIGKERLGLWLGQRLVCEVASSDDPCGSCASCRMALRLEHPDVHWFFPLPRPDAASTPEKLREKLEEARGAELAARRADPFHLPAYERPPAHFLAAILTLQRVAASRPALARRKVFVVGDAELMVPQESSPEAANAFLKLLEEPPPDTVLVLTTTRPGALLPTIVSRVLPVRLVPLTQDEVVELLLEAGTGPAEAARVAPLARGSLGRALRLRSVDGAPGQVEQLRLQARSLLEAALSKSAVPRLAAAHATAPAGARGEFVHLLDALAEWLRDLMAVAAGAQDHIFSPDAGELLRRAATPHLSPVSVASAIRLVDRAREHAEGNVNPQLILADLLRGMQTELRS